LTTNTFPAPPANFPGNIPEWYIFRALQALKVDFEFQSSFLGGRQDRGGAVLDFYIPGLNIGINIMSDYWHYNRADNRIADQLIKEMLTAMGLIVIYIDEESALANPIHYVREALAGRDHSRITR